MALADPVQSFNLPSRTARYAAGAVFLIAIVAGAASAAWSLASGQAALAPEAWTRAGLMQGETTRRLASELAQAPLPAAMADAERGASWLLAGSLGPRVRQGCGQWLFLVDELTVHPDARRNLETRLDAAAHMRTLLHGRGVELLIATVPDKSRVQHEQLCGIYRPASFSDRLHGWEEGLAQRGVARAALLPALEATRGGGDQPFLRTDTHWTETGARAAAEAIAHAMDRTGVELTPPLRYGLKSGEPGVREGDLVRLAGIDWLPMALQPAPDMVAPTRFSIEAPAAKDAAPGSGDTADDLFGDASLPSAALIGTSYSRTSSFVPFLETALHTPVPSFAQDGGDFWGAAKTYLASAEFRDTPPRVVIWEIPERVLQMPIVAEERAWMDSLEAAVEKKAAP
ncbi:cell division protein FtsQ [Pusillimonas caeni]|uniref:alginate O-acetyltransferase AlgX-related protein n=1 Tax=Pusillimonas caeni TaxID=1348472 RepID=UPI000E5A0A02|nr:cell division protein FtsQ [Pusillimonas caeni]TFL13863.1 cell division protein FtsQ [Pusillimonas caeni]